MATPLPMIHARFTLAELADATGGTRMGEGAHGVTGVGTDTRMLPPGALFVALVGERFDGHDHLVQAMERGAGGLLVRHGTAIPAGVPAVAVEDTLVALGALARHHVGRVKAAQAVGALPVVAIGGAVGKTTTKELTAAAMAAVHGEVLATRGNLNNLVGAPVMLLTLAPSHRAAVIECGTNAAGEIARLGGIIQPDVAMVMNADAAHTQGLGSIEGVAREEGSLFGFARRAVVGNADEPLSAAEMDRAGPGVARWYFGVDARADVRVVGRELLGNGRARVSMTVSEALCPGTGTVRVDTSLMGPAVATNLAAALCATAAVGATATDLHRAARAMGDVPTVPGRLDLKQVPWADGTVWLLDDTYNSSPRALAAALDAARELAATVHGRLVVALGDMLELGSLSDEAHTRAGEAVLAAGAVVFVGVGPAMAQAVTAAQGVAVRLGCTDSARAGNALRDLVTAGDVVLVKGSRGMRMERCVDALRGPT